MSGWLCDSESLDFFLKRGFQQSKEEKNMHLLPFYPTFYLNFSNYFENTSENYVAPYEVRQEY